MIANNVAPIPGSRLAQWSAPFSLAEGWTPPLRGLCGHSALRPAGSRRAKRLLSCLGQDQRTIRPVARTFACESFSAARRLQVDPGKREWRQNQAETREDDRIPVRRRRQQSDARFRGATRCGVPSTPLVRRSRRHGPRKLGRNRSLERHQVVELEGAMSATGEVALSEHAFSMRWAMRWRFGAGQEDRSAASSVKHIEIAGTATPA
jgi:hypothetical protein